MSLALILVAVVSLSIAIIISKSLFKEIKTKSLNKKEAPLILIALSYLTLSIIPILWTLQILEFKPQDLLSILSIILAIQTISIIKIFSEIKKTNKTFYFLIPYIPLIPLLKFYPNLLHISIPISIFITLLIFLKETTIHERTTRYLILYTSISLFAYTLTIFFQSLTTSFALISTTLFLAFIIPFLRLLKLQIKRKFAIPKKPESPLVHFLKHFLFIIIITNFVFIGTVSIHEFGHLVSSSQSNCEETKIVYELEGLPHTKIKCADTSQKNIWILGGILPPFIIALFLFFSGGKFIKELALQMTGFNLIISYLDIISLEISKALAIFSIIAGILMVASSLVLLAKSRIE